MEEISTSITTAVTSCPPPDPPSHEDEKEDHDDKTDNSKEDIKVESQPPPLPPPDDHGSALHSPPLPPPPPPAVVLPPPFSPGDVVDMQSSSNGPFFYLSLVGTPFEEAWNPFLGGLLRAPQPVFYKAFYSPGDTLLVVGGNSQVNGSPHLPPAVAEALRSLGHADFDWYWVSIQVAHRHASSLSSPDAKASSCTMVDLPAPW